MTIDLVRSGEIVGMVGASVSKDGTCRYVLSGVAAECHEIAGRLATGLVHRIETM